MTVLARTLPVRPCLVLSLALPLLTFGQWPGGLSLKAGGNYTGYRDPLGTEHWVHTGHRAEGGGFYGGLAWEARSSVPLGLCLEVQTSFNSTGYTFDEAGQGYPTAVLSDGRDRGRRSMRTTQLEVPALMVWRHWPGLRLEAGPCFGRMLQATEIRKGTRTTADGEIPLDERTDRTAELAAWEFSMVLGFVVEGPHGLHFQARYRSGFTDLDSPMGLGPSYTRQLQVGLLFTFSGGGEKRATATVLKTPPDRG